MPTAPSHASCLYPARLPSDASCATRPPAGHGSGRGGAAGGAAAAQAALSGRAGVLRCVVLQKAVPGFLAHLQLALRTALQQYEPPTSPPPSTLPPLPFALALSNPEQKESSGYRLMTAMGWKEGEGLGASKQGIKSHIKVKKKFENWGVGAVSDTRRPGWELRGDAAAGLPALLAPAALLPARFAPPLPPRTSST